MVEQLTHIAKNPKVESVISPTPTTRWFHEFLTLEAARDKKITKKFVPVEGKPAIVSAAANKLLLQCPTERELCRFIGTIVQPLVPHLYLVSSEEHPWLPVVKGKPKYNQKPDLLIAPKPFLHFLYSEKKAKPSSMGLPVLQEGTPVQCPRLWDSLIIGDAKKSLDDLARGELLNHITLLTEHCKGEVGKFRAFLFSKKQFELWEVLGNYISIRICASWTDPGSKKLFKNFFQPKHFGYMSTLLDTACRRFEVSLVDQSSVYPTPFLGAGAYGTVFRVCDSDGEYALKVTLGEANVALLKSEFEMLEKVHKWLPRRVVRPIFCESWFEGQVAAGAMLIAPVLSPCNIAFFEKKGLLCKAFDALFELHLEGFVHGDARIANILFNPEDRSFVWCDFMEAESAIKSFSYQKDVSSFVRSFLSTLPAKVATMISKYNPVNFAALFAQIFVLVIFPQS